jgi:crotonobetainyl-CoA:carnitine CoA-transferase CaiB-like acyl-CoA transferase
MPGPAFGDVQSGMALAGGIAAALYHRIRTGEGLVVDTSLLAAGLWSMQGAIAGSSLLDRDDLPFPGHDLPRNPLWGYYRTADDAIVMLAMFQADKHWSVVCGLAGHPELADDPRFVDSAAREEHAVECVAAIQTMVGARNLAEWERLLATQQGPWDVVLKPGEAARNAQTLANDYVQRVEYGDDRSIPMVSAPVQFDVRPVPLRPAPSHSEHAVEILVASGLSEERIIALKLDGTVF